MTLVGLNPDGVRTLSTTMRTASDEADGLSAEVKAALELSELTSNVPAFVDAEAIELEKVGVVLAARADLAEGFAVDIEVVADALGVTTEDAQQAVAVFGDPAFDDDSADPLLAIVAQDHFLFERLPRSIRDVAIGLPAEGEDPDLDGAVSRLNQDLLPALLRDKSIDPNDLSKQQRADLKVLAVALGGDEITVTVTRTKEEQAGQGDTRTVTFTEEVPLTDAGSDVIVRFVQGTLEDDAGLRRFASQLGDVSNAANQQDLSTLSKNTGLAEPDLRKLLDAVELMAFVGGVRAAASPGSITDGLTVDEANKKLRDLREDLATSEQGERISSAVGGSSGVGSVGLGFAALLGGTILAGPAFGLGLLSLGAFLADYAFSREAGRTKNEIEEREEAERKRFREQGDDADDNDFPDFGDPNDTVDPNDPNDTGGSGLI